ncbi:DUF1572 family protein [Zunongwangia sp.]|uniref:DUF1572 family protein n=1 Tax=Zunongwangia sp. TaxID=1965325 RepID=UPI003AA842B7
MNTETNYLKSIQNEFVYYKSLGEKTIEQLEDDELFWQYNKESNSVAILINHLSGNMKSRWTDFLTSDGEKQWRNRDLEFEAVLNTRKEVLLAWEEGWAILFDALNKIESKHFQQEIYIRNQRHSIIEAINRQLAHYSYHIGQLVFLGKMIISEKWKELSIPKNQSTHFNRQKFSKGKHGGHFSDDLE